MQVLKDGKEVKGATVVYYATGTPAHVTVDGVNYDPKAFELKDDEPVKKTTAVSGVKKTKDVAEVTEVKEEATAEPSGALTTEDVKN